MGGKGQCRCNAFWQVFHQVHHSPSRIEVLTSFYKHPIEIASNTVLSASILYGLLGLSLWGRLVVQLLRSDRRILLSRELSVARLAQVLHPDAGTSLDPPSARRS